MEEVVPSTAGAAGDRSIQDIGRNSAADERRDSWEEAVLGTAVGGNQAVRDGIDAGAHQAAQGTEDSGRQAAELGTEDTGRQEPSIVDFDDADST